MRIQPFECGARVPPVSSQELNSVRTLSLALVAACIGLAGTIGVPRAQATIAAPQPAAAVADLDSTGVAALFPVSPSDYACYADALTLDLNALALGGDRRIDLALQRTEIFAADAAVSVGTAAGDAPAARPPVAIFSGRPGGNSDDLAVIGISPFGVNGLILLGQETFIVSSGPYGAHLPTIVYSLRSLPPGAITWLDFSCGTDDLLPPPAADRAGRGGVTRGTPCRRAKIALDSDWHFTNTLFGGNTAASAAYAATLFAAVSEIYVRDVNTRLEISFLRVFGDPNDPWSDLDCFGQLDEFVNHWNAFMTGVERDAAHFLSPRRGIGCGGVAYLPGLCQDGYDYGADYRLDGFFPYPLQNHNAQNWDMLVTSHELGHNFGAPHTHSKTPPVDGCGLGDCNAAFGGTIMSYCHTCAGGLTNIVLSLHPRVINEDILPYLEFDAPCNLIVNGPTILDQPDALTRCVGSTSTFAVVAAGNGSLTYQWRKGAVPIPGATASSYSILSTQASDAGSYGVAVTDGCGTTISQSAVLTVTPATPGDADHDCDVDQDDLDLVLFNFGQNVPPGSSGDADGDGDVDQDDLDLVLFNFGS